MNSSLYKPLDPSGDQIRLLELAPMDGIDEKIVCRMVTVSLNKDKDFIALSHLWGDTEKIESATVNYTKIPITADLAQALKHLRSALATETPSIKRDRMTRKRSFLDDLRQQISCFAGRCPPDEKKRPIRIWVDAVCINQLDEEERANSTNMTRKVFQVASKVVAWLGPANEKTHFTVKLIKDIDDFMPPDWQAQGDRETYPEDYSPELKWIMRLPYVHPYRDFENEKEFENVPWRPALSDFLERPYWSRDWIVREVTAAKSPCCLIGTWLLSWKAVLRFILLLEEVVTHETALVPPQYKDSLKELPLAASQILLDDCQKRKYLEA